MYLSRSIAVEKEKLEAATRNLCKVEESRKKNDTLEEFLRNLDKYPFAALRKTME